MLRFALLLPVFMFVSFPSLVLAADRYTDFDKRVARTLYNTLKPGSVATKDKADPGKLDQPPRKDGNKAAYSINIPGKDGGSMYSGFYRVSVNTTMSPTTSWTELGRNEETGAQVIYRKVDETTADKYKQYAARKQIGNVILTIIIRRPFDENENGAAADMIRHYKAFYANAVDNKLFAGVRLTILAGAATGEDIEAPSDPLPFMLPNPKADAKQGVRVEYVAMVLDSDDQPVENVKTLRIRVVGKLLPYATIESPRARYNASAKVWEIDRPKAEGEKFALVLKSQDPKFLEALYKMPATAEADETKGIPAIAVKVGAAFK